jgi:hypothetical protein
MKVKVNGKCSIDLALRFKKTEYLLGIDLLDWSLFARKSTEHGYESVRILCFLVAKLDRVTFDAWLTNQFTGMFSDDHMADLDPRKPVRQDVM